jgi:hypothetical protein
VEEPGIDIPLLKPTNSGRQPSDGPFEGGEHERAFLSMFFNDTSSVLKILLSWAISSWCRISCRSKLAAPWPSPEASCCVLRRGNELVEPSARPPRQPHGSPPA